MNSFSISQLEQFSGIKAHTIRIWEQRYNALRPDRSEGNTRHYDNAQLRRLLNIVSLMDFGYKVSELCLMPDKKLFDLIDGELMDSSVKDGVSEYFVSQLLVAGMNYDEPYFEKIFSNCLLRFGMKHAYTKVVYPMLSRIGLMWTSDRMPPAQEHFISNLLRQKLFAAIDALPPAKRTDNGWLLFLPEGEFHEMGLLLSNYLLRQAGMHVIYLGSNVPFFTLKKAIDEIAPTRLLFFWVHNNTLEAAQQYLDDLVAHFNHVEVCFAGHEKLISQLQIRERTHWVQSIEALEKQFD